MPNLTTRYMGLELENPVIVGSSGLTSTVDRVKECDAAGAGAVVLKSIFEEQITAEVQRIRDASGTSYWHPEAEEYIREYGRHHAAEAYIDLIKACKDAVSIPVIASIHCVSAGGWTEFAHKVEHAGADALELNVYVLPSDPRRDGRENEQVYFDVVDSVRSVSKIPLALKIGPSFSSISNMCIALGASDIQALVLFNRFHQFDFDIENMKMVAAPHLSSPEEMTLPLRWISILAGRVDCDLAATTGVHDGAAVVKQLLAGANAVQVCSSLYKHGIAHVGTIIEELLEWMDRHGRSSVDEFRGKMSQDASSDPASYERVQFMKGSVAGE
ncbi:MAG: dihydroorotate dehydrogenase-like protein [Candidatus Eisenbacteria bacterium]|nr:dihydroorotate dehydrogenase-like protein [Candidatus Eisenbacteria bacterium]